jgi:hypothetical protein
VGVRGTWLGWGMDKWEHSVDGWVGSLPWAKPVRHFIQFFFCRVEIILYDRFYISFPSYSFRNSLHASPMFEVNFNVP